MYDSLNTYSGRKPKKRNIAASLILIFITVSSWAGILFFLIHFAKENANGTELLSPLSENIQTFRPEPTPAQSQLKQIVNKSLEGTQGDYGIVIYNFKTHESYLQNAEESFQSASLYKLWVMATAYDMISSGTLKRDELLSQDASFLNEKFQIATDAAEITEGTITMSVDNALEQMITISHNYAALLLSWRIRLASVSSLIENLGLENSSLGNPPKTTASDIALFLEKLYNGRIVSKELSNEMLERMKRQQLNGGLPKYLDENIMIAHKTGELDEVKHDVGIVFSPKGDYIIVALSKSDFPEAAQERIALLSKDVYTYFSTQ